MADISDVKIMVGSTVYGFQDQLSAIWTTLSTIGYRVLNSHMGTIKVDPHLSNLQNCLNAVEECDLFLGVIRPYYGTGNIGDINITFEEIKRAIELKKPYWFLVHRDVVFARQLTKKLFYINNTGEKVYDVKIDPSPIFDARTLEIYDHVIKSADPVVLRTGNWAQEFFRLDDALRYIQTQFSDTDFIASVLKNKV